MTDLHKAEHSPHIEFTAFKLPWLVKHFQQKQYNTKKSKTTQTIY